MSQNSPDEKKRLRRWGYAWLIAAWLMLAACCATGTYLHDGAADGWGTFFGISCAGAIIMAIAVFVRAED